MRLEHAEPREPGPRGPDLAAAILHLLGAALSAGAILPLLVRAARGRSALAIVGFSLYGASLLYYFLISSLAHLLLSARARRVFGGLDEAGSYFLLAGSWTPLCFGAFRGGLGWSLFGLLWGFALLCYLASSLLGGPIRNRLLAGYYLAVALLLPLLRPLRERLGALVFAWLLLAGIVYAAGLVFRSREEIAYSHGVWHAFVVAASTCHYFALLAS